MVLTAKLLAAAGFAYWDMGQEHQYKLGLGATMEPRQAFLERFREARRRPNLLDEMGQRSPQPAAEASPPPAAAAGLLSADAAD